MTLQLFDIAPVDPAKARRHRGSERTPLDASPYLLSRRGFLRKTAQFGVAAGLASVALAFPMARPARAHDGHAILDSCPSYASGHDCLPGCGPSPVCDHCCKTSGSYSGYHKSTGNYAWRPNECRSGYWDGWNWFFGQNCRYCCYLIEYRCHDGWLGFSGGSSKTICRWTIDCGSCGSPT